MAAPLSKLPSLESLAKQTSVLIGNKSTPVFDFGNAGTSVKTFAVSCDVTSSPIHRARGEETNHRNTGKPKTMTARKHIGNSRLAKEEQQPTVTG